MRQSDKGNQCILIHIFVVVTSESTHRYTKVFTNGEVCISKPLFVLMTKEELKAAT